MQGIIVYIPVLSIQNSVITNVSTLVFSSIYHRMRCLNLESVSYQSSWVELAPVQIKVAAWFLIRALGMILTL